MKLPGLARVGFGVAAAVALLMWFSAAENPVVGIPVAVFFTAAAVGLWRGRAWSGYGSALLILIFVAASVLRMGDASVPLVQLTVALGISLAVAMLLFLGGRAVAERSASRAWPWLAICAGTAAFLGLFQLMIVPTGGMENTILQGDSLLARRVMLRAPERGDVVMHRYPLDRRQTFLKRVVGLPGDRIRFEDKRLFVNGVEAREPYVKHTTDYMDSYRDQFPKYAPRFEIFPSGREMLEKHVRDGELTVPEGRLFVLGDNRDSSLDSRYWGFIEPSSITGKPVMVLFSADLAPSDRAPGWAGLWQPLRHARWNRMFHRL